MPTQDRHRNKSQLEHLKEMPILLEFKLSSSITLEAYGARADTVCNGAKFSSKTAKPWKTMPVYLCCPSDDK